MKRWNRFLATVPLNMVKAVCMTWAGTAECSIYPKYPLAIIINSKASQDVRARLSVALKILRKSHCWILESPAGLDNFPSHSSSAYSSRFSISVGSSRFLLRKKPLKRAGVRRKNKFSLRKTLWADNLFMPKYKKKALSAIDECLEVLQCQGLYVSGCFMLYVWICCTPNEITFDVFSGCCQISRCKGISVYVQFMTVRVLIWRLRREMKDFWCHTKSRNTIEVADRERRKHPGNKKVISWLQEKIMETFFPPIWTQYKIVATAWCLCLAAFVEINVILLLLLL